MKNGIEKYHNTNVETLTGMIEVSDDIIRAGGKQVKLGKDADVDGGELALRDPEVFGSYGSGKMGYIELGRPVVNIQYVLGKKPILSATLGIPVARLEKILNYEEYVVVESSIKDICYKSILSIKEAHDTEEKYGEKIMLLTGAEVIEYMLKKEKMEGKEKIILHTIPVLPLDIRYKKEEDGTLVPYTINLLYQRIITGITRLEKLESLHAPNEIKENEKRKLQESCSSLINNGVGKNIFLYCFHPIDTFAETFGAMNRRYMKLAKEKIHVDREKFEELVDKYNRYEEDHKEAIEYDENLGSMIYTLSDEAEEKLKEMEKEIKTKCFDTLIEQIVVKDFVIYNKFKDQIKEAVKERIGDRLGEYYNACEKRQEKDRFFSDIEKGIAGIVEFYVEKRLKWEVKEEV